MYVYGKFHSRLWSTFLDEVAIKAVKNSISKIHFDPDLVLSINYCRNNFIKLIPAPAGAKTA
jgi:hypothetical protein